jgi:hypothetical protein
MSGGIGIGVSFEFHEVDPDGSLCSQCKTVIEKSMYKLYLSVNTGDELGFELIPSKYIYCESCKVNSENGTSE